jgi:hypothetical protein
VSHEAPGTVVTAEERPAAADCQVHARVTRVHYRRARSEDPRAPHGEERAFVLRTHRDGDIERINDPDVQAVVLEPVARPPWLDAVAQAVENGSFSVPRTIARASVGEVETWLETELPDGPHLADIRRAVKQDVLSLVRRAASGSVTSNLMFRVHTDAPNRRCGFHVDTVAPSAPTVGYLRVYNGRGTEYVEPQNITSMRDFYRHLSRRERLIHEDARFRATSDVEQVARVAAELQVLDESPDFLVRPDDIRVAPAGSIVAFKHLDVRLHWSDHAKALAWVHRSPMDGAARLVVNVAASAPSEGGR